MLINKLPGLAEALYTSGLPISSTGYPVTSQGNPNASYVTLSDGTVFEIDWLTMPTQTQLAAATAIVQGWPPLAVYQQARIAAIQARTQQLLAQGFAWSGDSFPISDVLIARWEGLLLKAQGGRVMYPYQVPTVQLKKVQLKNQNDLNGLYQAAEARYETLLSTNDGSGGEGDLICQVMAATTKAAVDQIVDARS